MRTRFVGSLAKVVFLPALSLVLVACGTNGSNNQSKICGGCAFLYATTNANQILDFSINSSGALGSLGSNPGPANGPDILGVGFAPQPPYGGPLYVSDPKSNAIDVFVVNGKDGTFTTLKGSPFSVGGPAGTPAGLLTFGTYLYAGDTNGSIAAFNVGASGALTAIPGAPFAAGAAPLHLVTTYIGSPSVPPLYAADSSGGGIWAFVIGSNGALTPVPGSPFATPSNSAPAGMIAEGNLISGNILYVALSGLNQIAAFSISGSGALAPLPGSPFATGSGPGALFTFANFVYAMNNLDHTISGYNVDLNTGLLSQMQGSPFPAGTATGSPIIGPHGGGVFYVPDLQSNAIRGFIADFSNGSLAPLPGSPFAATAGPVALTAIALPVVDPP